MRDAAMRGRDLVRMEEGRKEAKDEMWSGGGALGDGKVVAWWWPVRASEGVATERFALENIFAYFAFKVSICD